MKRWLVLFLLAIIPICFVTFSPGRPANQALSDKTAWPPELRLNLSLVDVVKFAVGCLNKPRPRGHLHAMDILVLFMKDVREISAVIYHREKISSARSFTGNGCLPHSREANYPEVLSHCIERYSPKEIYGRMNFPVLGRWVIREETHPASSIRKI
ncbi:uncharacterized protein EV420DRAFT_1484965 [Desarmillaria tabescens]|uniref:Uncharacterized protein n=1 Tax=Armillaria tabescens TaxID=1929756 RepID=A0AA39JLB6_ARMTA|nr:uncharacterized protein EV420DRAFT_1484965 [Desarmillaria tabescens]KAK0443439.1 hypothetical protein EV420DRAFT_1484965 [Desarmillaria tabescens]